MQLQLLLNCSKPRAVDVRINDFTLALSDYTSQSDNNGLLLGSTSPAQHQTYKISDKL